MTKQVCIIGGSGFVGRAITREAIRRGYRVSVGCRHPERARALQVDGAVLHKVDLANGNGLHEAIAGAGAVINLVGILFERGRQSFDAIHLHGTERIVAACQATGIKRYVHMSALGGGSNPGSDYARSKGLAEEVVRESDLDWTIFRPSVIYGEGDVFFNRFKFLSSLAPVLPVISGKSRLQPVWVEDVARAFVDALGMNQTIGQSYDLGGPDAYSMHELMQILMGELDRYRLLLPLPSFAAKAGAVAASLLPNPPLTLDQLRMLERDNVVEGEPFPSIFGEAAKVSQVLPTYIHGRQPERLQRQLDQHRTIYRK